LTIGLEYSGENLTPGEISILFQWSKAFKWDNYQGKGCIVNNVDSFTTNMLLSKAWSEGKITSEFNAYMNQLINIYMDNEESQIWNPGLPPVPSADFPTQWVVIRDWDATEAVAMQAKKHKKICFVLQGLFRSSNEEILTKW